MYRAFPCARGVYDKVCCTWIISLCPLICPGALVGAREGGVSTRLCVYKWWSATAGFVFCGEELVPLDEYGGAAEKYAGREVSLVMGSPSGPTGTGFCRFRFNHHRRMRQATRIPITIATTTPAIMPPLGEFATELGCAEVVVSAAKGGSEANSDAYSRAFVPGEEVELAPSGLVRRNASIFTPLPSVALDLVTVIVYVSIGSSLLLLNRMICAWAPAGR